MSKPTQIQSPRVSPTALDRVIGYLSPAAGLRRHAHRQMLARAYAAAAPGDAWRPRRPGASANADHEADASMLRAKSRSLIQNVEYIAAGMNARVAHSVGTGIMPKWGGRDGEALKALWDAWAPRADADGVLDIYGIQALAARTMDADGECLLRIRSRRETDGLPVPLQLQVLEVDYLDTMRTSGDDGNQVRGGKEYDALGRVVAYWLYPFHPGDSRAPIRARGLTSKRVPAQYVIHLFAPGRPGASRGFPRLAPVIARARDLQLLEDAELQRKNLEGRLSVLASGDVGALAEGASYGTDVANGSLGELASGGITQVPGGMNITVVEPKAAPGFVDYCRYNIKLICAGGGFTYEQATGDMSEVNFSSARVRLLDFRREIEQLQWLTLVPQLCDRICREFVAYAEVAGKLSTRGRAQYTLGHSTPKWDYVNPVQEVEADLSEISGGLASFSEKLRQRGYDPTVVFDEIEADIKGLQARGVWDHLIMLMKGKTMPSEAPRNGS